MFRVARSRNHQTQNAQRPQQRKNVRELNVHGRPLYELCCYNMLAEGLIVCQSKTTTELTVRA